VHVPNIFLWVDAASASFAWLGMIHSPAVDLVVIVFKRTRNVTCDVTLVAIGCILTGWNVYHFGLIHLHHELDIFVSVNLHWQLVIVCFVFLVSSILANPILMSG
jgi:hypothetical protein